MAIVSARNLAVRYGEHQAVVDVSLDIEPGEVVSVIGPNGAGKTTTVEVLEGFRRRSGGEVQVLGEDPERAGSHWRAQLGMVLQSTSLDSDLTVAETIELYGALYPDPKPVGEALELVGLTSEAKTKVGQLSGGQQRRVDLAVGVVGNPRLLFLDEPTTGLDPEAREHAWTAVQNLISGGTTVLLTTHYLEEARRLADRIVVLAEGRVIADDQPNEIVRMLGTGSDITFRLRDPGNFDTLPTRLAARTVGRSDEVAITVQDSAAALAELLAWGRGHREDLDGLQVALPSLESAYLELISHAHEGVTQNG